MRHQGQGAFYSVNYSFRSSWARIPASIVSLVTLSPHNPFQSPHLQWLTAASSGWIKNLLPSINRVAVTLRCFSRWSINLTDPFSYVWTRPLFFHEVCYLSLLAVGVHLTTSFRLLTPWPFPCQVATTPYRHLCVTSFQSWTSMKSYCRLRAYFFS